MGGSTTSSQTTKSKTNPWEPTIPGLKGIIGQIEPRLENTGLTGFESGAINSLLSNAQGGNLYAPQISNLAGDLFGGGIDRTGMVNQSYGDLQSSLTPFARGDFLDPTSNPFYQTVSNDVANRVNSMFAGAGRDLSPAHTQTLARGIAEGTAPLYENERARQLGAISAMFGGGLQSSGLLSALDQTSLANRQAGIGASTAAMQAADQGPNQILAAEALRRGLPLENIGALESLLVPIAQLGGQQKSTTTGTTSQPLGQQLVGGAIGGAGVLGRLGAFGPQGWLFGGSGSGITDPWAGLR